MKPDTHKVIINSKCSSWESNSKQQILVCFSTKLYSRLCKWVLQCEIDRRNRNNKTRKPRAKPVILMSIKFIILRDYKNNINKSETSLSSFRYSSFRFDAANEEVA